MKNDKLLDAIGQVDDSLIDEAEHVRRAPKPKPTPSFWRRWGSLVATLILVIGLTCGFIFLGRIFSFGGFDSSSYQEASDMESVPSGEDTETTEEEAGDVSGESSQEGTLNASEKITDESSPGSTEDHSSYGQAAGPAELEETAPMTHTPGTAGEGNAETTKPEGITGDSPESELLTEPPALYVNGAEIRSGSYEWTFPDGDEMSTIFACGAFVLDREDTITAIQLYGQDSLKLETVENGLESISAYCYSGDSWGNDQAEPMELTVDGTVITLPDDSQDWILVVTLTWEDENYSGNAEYYFTVHQN